MKNSLTRTKNEVLANYLPHAAYKSALALATAHKGEIGKTDKGNFMATFNSVETAKKFVAEWTAQYNANRKVDLAPNATTPTQKPKASKGSTAPSTKEMTAEEEYNFCYDLAKANGTLGNLEVAMQLGELATRAKAERDTKKAKPSKPTATKGKTSSAKKTTKKADSKKSMTSPSKAKGNKKSTLENFVLNNPSCTRAEALAHGFIGTKSELALLKKSLGVR